MTPTNTFNRTLRTLVRAGIIDSREHPKFWSPFELSVLHSFWMLPEAALASGMERGSGITDATQRWASGWRLQALYTVLRE